MAKNTSFLDLIRAGNVPFDVTIDGVTFRARELKLADFAEIQKEFPEWTDITNLQGLRDLIGDLPSIKEILYYALKDFADGLSKEDVLKAITYGNLDAFLRLFRRCVGLPETLPEVQAPTDAEGRPTTEQ